MIVHNIYTCIWKLTDKYRANQPLIISSDPLCVNLLVYLFNKQMDTFIIGKATWDIWTISVLIFTLEFYYLTI